MGKKDPPAEVMQIRRQISAFFEQEDDQARAIGRAKCGVYAFFDYDGEPIYVGQTVEGLRARVGRHLTGRRSDAVAKFVLDPFEVLEIEVWPLFNLENVPKTERKATTNRVEYGVFQKARADSRFNAVLNEGTIAEVEPIELPPSFRGRLIPDDLYELRKHPDVRIARRASTIASLARLISERVVSKGLRITLLVQAQRLEALAKDRLNDFADDPIGVAEAEED